MDNSLHSNFLASEDVVVKIKIIHKLMEIIDFLKTAPVSAFSNNDAVAEVQPSDNVDYKQAVEKLMEATNLRDCETAVKALWNSIKNQEQKLISANDTFDIAELINMPDFEVCKLSVRALLSTLMKFDGNSNETFQICTIHLLSKTKNTSKEEFLKNILQILKYICLNNAVFRALDESKGVSFLETLTKSSDVNAQKNYVYIVAGLIFKLNFLNDNLFITTSIPSTIIELMVSQDLEIKSIAAAAFMLFSKPHKTKQIAENVSIHRLLPLLNFPNIYCRQIALNAIGYFVRENNENLQTLIDLNIIQQIANLLKCQDICCHAIFALECVSCGNVEQKHSFLKSNVVPDLVKLLYSKNDRIIIGSLNILGAIAVLKEVTDAIVVGGALPRLLELLNKDNERLCKWSIYVLRSMVRYCTITLKEAIINAGVIKSYVKLLGVSDEKILCEVLDGINEFLLCKEKNFAEDIVEAETVPNVVKLLKFHNPSIIILKALFSLNCIAKNYCVEEIFIAGAIPVLYEILETSENEDIRDGTCQLLGRLASADESIIIDSIEALLSINWMNSARILVEIFQNHPKSVDMVIKCGIMSTVMQLFHTADLSKEKFGVWVLMCIAEDEEKIQTIIDAGFVPYLIKFLDSNEQFESILPDLDTSRPAKIDTSFFLKLQKKASIAATAIAWIALGNTEQKEVVIQSGAVPLLIKLLESPNSDICSSATLAIAHISDGTDEQKQVIIDAGILPKLIKLLSDPKVCESTITSATMVLCNIACGNSDQMFAIIEVGAIPALINLLDSLEFDTRESAASVFYYIVRGCDIEDFEIVTKSGAIPYLIKHLEHEARYEYSVVPSILADITFGSHEDIEIVVNAKAIPLIIKFLSSSNTEVLESAIITVANIAFDSEEYAKEIFNTGALSQIIKSLESHHLSICNAAVRATGAIAGGGPEQVQAIINAEALPSLLQILKNSNKYDILEIVTALSYMSMGTMEQRELLISSQIIDNLVILLDSTNLWIYGDVAEIFMYLSDGKEEHKQAIIDANSLPRIVKLLGSSSTLYATQCAAKVISNLADGSKAQIQFVIESGAIPALVNLLKSSSGITLQNATTALANISEGTAEHKKTVIKAGALIYLNELANSDKQEVSRPAMRALYNLKNINNESDNFVFLHSKL